MFKDPIRPKKVVKPYQKTDPYDYKTMEYDNRSGGFIKAGLDFGVGMRNPVGHLGKPKEFVDVLPMTSRTENGVRDNEKY